MRRIDLALLCAVATVLMGVVAGCYSGGETTAVDGERQPAGMQTVSNQSNHETAVARVMVVDMNGNPLAHMMPIATTEPNAFNKPLASGQITGPDGKGYVTIPQNQWLYVRAWDPTRRMFANNYYDVLPGRGHTTDEMRIVMLPSAALRAIVHDAEGTALASQNIGMMMSHPTKGPWWPAEARTNETGAVVFEGIPAGTYQVTLESITGKQIQLPAVALPPGGSTDLGPITLQ